MGKRSYRGSLGQRSICRRRARPNETGGFLRNRSRGSKLRCPKGGSPAFETRRPLSRCAANRNYRARCRPTEAFSQLKRKIGKLFAKWKRYEWRAPLSLLKYNFETSQLSKPDSFWVHLSPRVLNVLSIIYCTYFLLILHIRMNFVVQARSYDTFESLWGNCSDNWSKMCRETARVRIVDGCSAVYFQLAP